MKTVERKRVEVRVDADTDRLYGDIDKAILYLAEVRDQYQGKTLDGISLDEHWTGYEDMEMTFVYYREETDEELSRRLEQEAAEKRYQEKLNRESEQRSKDVKELKRLASKLGYRL